MDIPRCIIIGGTKRERIIKLLNVLPRNRFYKENVGFTSDWGVYVGAAPWFCWKWFYEKINSFAKYDFEEMPALSGFAKKWLPPPPTS